MKPTLYADDLNSLNGHCGNTAIRFERCFGIDLARVLPRRCENCDDRGRCNGKAFRHSIHIMNIHDCHTCDGLGFLYPDPPDWYGANSTHPERRIRNWRNFLHQVWHVLGIVDETDE